MPFDNSISHLAVAMASFVATHFVMSGPLRGPLVSALGAQWFLLFYSVVSLATMAWGAIAYDRAVDTAPLWNGVHPVAWAAGSILTIVAVALILPSFARNPALPGAKSAGLSTVIPSGVFTITRHPMMWGFSLWAAGHIVVAPQLRVLIFMGSLIVLALLGSYFQDQRKLAENEREFSHWQRRTSFWPDIRNFGQLKLTWITAVVLWFLATVVHWEFFGIPAGLWLILG